MRHKLSILRITAGTDRIPFMIKFQLEMLHTMYPQHVLLQKPSFWAERTAMSSSELEARGMGEIETRWIMETIHIKAQGAVMMSNSNGACKATSSSRHKANTAPSASSSSALCNTTKCTYGATTPLDNWALATSPEVVTLRSTAKAFKPQPWHQKYAASILSWLMLLAVLRTR